MRKRKRVINDNDNGNTDNNDNNDSSNSKRQRRPQRLGVVNKALRSLYLQRQARRQAMLAAMGRSAAPSRVVVGRGHGNDDDNDDDDDDDLSWCGRGQGERRQFLAVEYGQLWNRRDEAQNGSSRRSSISSQSPRQNQTVGETDDDAAQQRRRQLGVRRRIRNGRLVGSLLGKRKRDSTSALQSMTDLDRSSSDEDCDERKSAAIRSNSGAPWTHQQQQQLQHQQQQHQQQQQQNHQPSAQQDDMYGVQAMDESTADDEYSPVKPRVKRQRGLVRRTSNNSHNLLM
eukprot:TRINITY_DN66816_c2_g1_i1.p1 TRINITY_DN66816_c2_g1~~TRINITY_DN66816_c2_g1_i1.p1  ORF type:complete len:286 (+),score=126.72 TRINITY_DN66816_c2_g1_i1:2-859(+)